MKKILRKINNLNIKSKLFIITSSLLVGTTLLVYSTLYYYLPYYYQNYKLDNLSKISENIKEFSLHNNKENLIQYIHYTSLDSNVMINVYDKNKVLIYGKHNFEKNLNPPKRDFKKYENCIKLKLINGEFLTAKITMPLQPIDEAMIVLKEILPLIIILALFISFLGAYIYSVYITKPLVNIINLEREQENKRKQFIATISHELKTPITIISGQLEGMIYNIGKYKDRDLYLKKTYDTTNELKYLVNEMMEISKADIIQDTLNLEQIDLNNIIESVVSKQVFLIDNKSLHINKTLNSSTKIIGDKDKLYRAIYNILNNAIKYSPANENIFISTINNINSTLLTIENTGVTIKEDDIKNLFNPFFRVEQSRNRKTGGSGLGLYITSQILKAHNYSFSIKSSNNSVVFTIIIPKSRSVL